MTTAYTLATPLYHGARQDRSGTFAQIRAVLRHLARRAADLVRLPLILPEDGAPLI